MKIALCVRNETCMNLVIGKTYRVVDDKRVEKEGYIRIVDESEEDYLYPKDGFRVIEAK